MSIHQNIEPFKIQSEQEADEYLQALFSKSEYRNLFSVEERIALVEGQDLRRYFIQRATEILAR